VSVLAQNTDVIHRDTSRTFFVPDMPSINTHAKFLTVADGKSYYKSTIKRKFRDTSNILDIKVLKGNEAKRYGELAKYGVVVITTKKFAQKEYQKKLCSFSADYKNYLEWQMKYNHSDNGILYIIEKKGDLVLLWGDKKIRELYDLPPDNISSVELNRKETCCGTNVSVIITTKN
jgi:hypothetical protein